MPGSPSVSPPAAPPSWPAEWLAGRLRSRLAEPLPGRRAQIPLEPELAYGRHFARPPRSAVPAAVCVVLYPGPAGWQVPLTVRPRHLALHPGQVSLPGGRVEPAEASSAAAVRELHEELGIAPREVELLGPLTPLYVFNSHAAVTPWLAVAAGRLEFAPSPAEVSEVLELPLARLLAGGWSEHREAKGPISIRAPHLPLGGHRIWGATAMILAEVAEVIREACPRGDEPAPAAGR